MSKVSALIIDDEADIRELLSITLSRMSIQTDTAENLAQGIEKLKYNTYSFCLTDMRLPDGSGIDFVTTAAELKPTLPVVVITAHGNTDTAVQAMKAGAYDFLNKPVDLANLRRLIESAVATSKLEPAEIKSDAIIGNSAAIEKLKAAIAKLARSQAPVYISGQSGTGKEMVARSIHQLGPRNTHAFVPVNCGAIPKDLVESEFFGHKKGAFTGADSNKPGLFQSADGGTLFLDEVADLPMDMQVKLLRAIQEKAIRPVGDQKEISVDVRILCATHKDLNTLVNAGEFRQDLYYRLNVIQLNVPKLKDRDNDLHLLIEHFLKRLNPANSLKKNLSREALSALETYAFPGNIRELENILERAYTLCDDEKIDINDLLLAETTADKSQDSHTKPSSQHYINCLNHSSIDDYLAEIEKEIISDALEHVRWNKTTAAKKLGISFRSFRYRTSKLGIDDENEI